MKKSKVLKVVLIFMALIAMCGVMAGCSKDKDKEKSKGGNSYEAPISNYFEGMQKADAKTFNKAYPDFYISVNDDDISMLKEDIEERYGKKYKITYEIKSVNDFSSSDLEIIEKYVKKIYEEDVKISEGKEVNIKASIKGDIDEDTNTTKLYVYKIDGEWKLLNISPSSAKYYVK